MIGRTCDREIYPGVHREGGSGEATGRGSSSQDRGLRGRVTQIRVTRDESQVSVGGLLALDQVLWKRWSCLTNFGTSTG
jgi:hypothetical protein